MSFATVFSRALLGVEAVEVTVESHLSSGIPGFALVGLPETAVKESKERVRSAIINSGFEFPTRRLTVNLAPADLPKSSGCYDLAIALSILAATGQIPEQILAGSEILGELALDGSVRQIRGALPAILKAKAAQRQILLPAGNASEMRLSGYEKAWGVESLLAFAEYVSQSRPLPQYLTSKNSEPEDDPLRDLCDIKGQSAGKQAIQLAAAGGHNLLMVGPPGCGKTLLAQTLVRLLPPLTESEALEVASINSVAGLSLPDSDWRKRPLRAPHHSATAVALVGGGSRATPGEISLAHRGVLFLDELTEFKRSVLESLREPLESGVITVSRANYRVAFPARFQLLAAMNPCPCGHAGDSRRECHCAPERIASYVARISGPLLDRIDLVVEMPGLSQAELLGGHQAATNWQGIRDNIQCCRQRQLQRQGKLNAALTVDEVGEYCGVTGALRTTLARAMDNLGLSARSVHRILRVARSIADFADQRDIRRDDLLQALAFRSKKLSR